MSRQIVTFFYGLFMDVDVLRAQGVHAIDVRRARVDDFALTIGERATLVPVSGARSYGMLMSITHEHLEILYAADDLQAYRPEAVLAQTLEGNQVVAALCYNLAVRPARESSNPGYAARLRDLLARYDFPSEYIATIA